MPKRYTTDDRGGVELRDGPSRLPPPGNGADPGELRTLLSDLTRDASQLAHDELTLAKMEIRDVAEAFSADLKGAGKTLVKDAAKVGVALSLASLAGLALTAGAILGIGQLLGGAFWAGGLIVGLVLALGAGGLAMSAAKSLQESDELRLEGGRRTLERDRSIMEEELRDTADFARDEARDFKRTMKSDRSGPPRPGQA